MTPRTMRLQAQDEKYLSTRRRKPVRRQRQQRDEMTAPKDARRMRPYVYGEER